MAKKYPGRDFVTDRGTAIDYRYKTLFDVARFPCERPVPRHGIGLRSMLEAGKPVPVEVYARCRRCQSCLDHRANLWTARAIDEIKYAPRTWFSTLTFSPEERFKRDLVAGVLNESSDLSDENVAARFRMRCRAYGTEVTKFLKRLRKKGKYRYLLVCEAHKDGTPHFHLLLHEIDTFRKRELHAAWRCGFSQFKLVSEERNAALYACKYLNKHALSRVRASIRYGQALTLTHITAKIKRLRNSANQLDRKES